MSIFFEYINLSLNTYFGIQLPSHAIIISIIILILSLIFILFYIRPAFILWFKLSRLRLGLKVFRRSDKSKYPTELFSRDSILNHLWVEYKETLHEQRTIHPQPGAEEIFTIRSTVPAEAFFNPGILVDSQLHTEFFKHLPGILTGMGIIGTFLGLIHGLSAFQLSEDTQVVRQSLDQLLHGVYEAFLISAGAIGIAMLITAIEKFFLSTLYRQVEGLCFLIDSLYESGASEEYLERLVKSAEASVYQTHQIKDSLVGELKQALHEIAHQQIEFLSSSRQQLGDQFQQIIRSDIGDPLQLIADHLKNQNEKTGRDISGALDGVLLSFTQRLQDLFGGQTAGIHALQQQTMDALQTTLQQFQQMATRIDATGHAAAAAMTEKLAQTMEATDSRQQTMSEHMVKFLSQIQSFTQESETATKRSLQELLGNLGQQMTRMMADLQTQTQAAATDQQERYQQAAEATLTAITTLSGGVQNALHAIQGQLTHTLAQLEQHTQRATTQQQEQQHQLATHNQRAVQQLVVGVDQTLHQVSTQTADLLTTLARTVESQQTTMANTVSRLMIDLQTQMRATTDEQHGRHQQVADATLATVTMMSNGMQGALHTLQEQLTHTLVQFEQHAQRAATQQQEQQHQLTAHQQKAMQQFTANVEQNIAQVSAQTTGLLTALVRTVENQQQTTTETVHAINMAVTRMGSVTTAALTDMNQSAETLMAAAREFSKAGQSVSGVLGETVGVTAKLAASADAISAATRALGTIVADYGAIRQQWREVIQSLGSVVEAARREASLTVDVLARIDSAAQKLAIAQNQADHYLSRVTDILQQAHQEFAMGMRRTLGEAHQQFFHHLTEATAKLREAIEELAITLSGTDDKTMQG